MEFNKKTFIIFGSLILFSVIFHLSIFGQESSSPDQRFVRIDKKLPTVLITFEKEVEIKDDVQRKNIRYVLLRLKNNSIWTIKMDASGGNKKIEDSSLYYQIIDDKGDIISERECHVCSVIGLKSGKSMLFSIPYDEITNANAVRIEFSFAWEDRVLVAPLSEPTHFVYFYKSDLNEDK